MSGKKISVVIPIHNTPQEFLNKCFKSIFSQKYDNFECILVDDGSNLITKQAINNIKKQHSNCFVYTLPKATGPGNARNVGVKNSTGDIIFYVDSDDYIFGDIFKVTSDIFTKYPDLDIFSFESKNINQHGDILNPSKYNFNTSVPVNVDNFNNALMDKCSVWAKAYRKEFLIKNDIWFYEKDIFAEDMFYLIVTYSKAKKIIFSDKAYYYTCLTYNSRSRTKYTYQHIHLFFKGIRLAYEKIKYDNNYVSKNYILLLKVFLYPQLNNILRSYTDREQLKIDIDRINKEVEEFKKYVYEDQKQINQKK